MLLSGKLSICLCFLLLFAFLGSHALPSPSGTSDLIQVELSRNSTIAENFQCIKIEECSREEACDCFEVNLAFGDEKCRNDAGFFEYGRFYRSEDHTPELHP